MAYRGAWRPVLEFLAAAIARQSGIRDYIDGEKVIQGFLAAYLGATEHFVVHTERELAGGYADICLEPHLQRYAGMRHGYVIELKYLKRREGAAEAQVARAAPRGGGAGAALRGRRAAGASIPVGALHRTGGGVPRLGAGALRSGAGGRLHLSRPMQRVADRGAGRTGGPSATGSEIGASCARRWGRPAGQEPRTRRSAAAISSAPSSTAISRWNSRVAPGSRYSSEPCLRFQARPRGLQLPGSMPVT